MPDLASRLARLDALKQGLLPQTGTVSGPGPGHGLRSDYDSLIAGCAPCVMQINYT